MYFWPLEVRMDTQENLSNLNSMTVTTVDTQFFSRDTNAQESKPQICRNKRHTCYCISIFTTFYVSLMCFRGWNFKYVLYESEYSATVILLHHIVKFLKSSEKVLHEKVFNLKS